MINFEQRLKRQMILNRIKKVRDDANLDSVYKNMMIKGLHNKVNINY